MAEEGLPPQSAPSGRHAFCWQESSQSSPPPVVMVRLHRRREDRSLRLCRLASCCQRGRSPLAQASLGRGNFERDPKPARTVPGSCERSIPGGAPRRSSRYGFLAAARRSNEAAVHSNELEATHRCNKFQCRSRKFQCRSNFQ